MRRASFIATAKPFQRSETVGRLVVAVRRPPDESSASSAMRCSSSSLFQHPQQQQQQVPSCSSNIVQQQRRTYVNVIVRKQLEGLFPTQATDNETDFSPSVAMHQIAELMQALQVLNICDRVFEMPALPYYDAIFPSDLIASYQDMLFPMPKFGFEHRSKEISDILRYIKSLGSPGDVSHVLQDTPGARANGGDFVNIPSGILLGHGKHRASTNTIAYDAFINTTVKVNDKVNKNAFPVYGVELPDKAPLLGDLMGFSGQRTLFVQDNEYGAAATKVIRETHTRVPWQIVKLEDRCDFLTFHGGLTCNDVIVDINCVDSIERIAEAGLNPYPIDWSEMRKIGVSMRRLCLVARFSLGGFSGGKMHQTKMTNTNRAPLGGHGNKYNQGQRTYGDMGAPLDAQIRSMEVPQPVYQPPPRYRAPLHNRGEIAAFDKERADDAAKRSSSGDADAGAFGGWRKDPALRQTFTETEAPYPRTNNFIGTNTVHPARTGTQPMDPQNVERFK